MIIIKIIATLFVGIMFLDFISSVILDGLLFKNWLNVAALICFILTFIAIW